MQETKLSAVVRPQMDVQMSASKELKPKTVLFHISHTLFKNKRLKRRLAGGRRKKSQKKRPKNKRKQEINGRPSPRQPQLSETIEIISTDEEDEPSKPEMEASIVLSSDDEDELTTQTRIFPMLTNETTVRTAVGNTVYELSLTQLKENLDTITKKDKKNKDAVANKRLSDTTSADVSISLLSDDEEDNNMDTQ